MYLRKIVNIFILSYHFSMISKALNNVGVLSTDIWYKGKVFPFSYGNKAKDRKKCISTKSNFTISMMIWYLFKLEAMLFTIFVLSPHNHHSHHTPHMIHNHHSLHTLHSHHIPHIQQHRLLITKFGMEFLNIFELKC